MLGEPAVKFDALAKKLCKASFYLLSTLSGEVHSASFF